MEEKKLTDEEVITALEMDCLCVAYDDNCDKCPLFNEDCGKILPKAIKDLVNRLQRENANVIAMNDTLYRENETLKSNKFASWKIKFFNLKEEFDKELEEHKEFTKKAKAEIERLTKKAEEATFWEKDYLEWATGFLKTRFDIKDWFTNPETQKPPCTYEFFASTLWGKIRPAMEWLDELKERNETLRKENAELQKQVDELKEERENVQKILYELGKCGNDKERYAVWVKLIKYCGVEVE